MNEILHDDEIVSSKIVNFNEILSFQIAQDYHNLRTIISITFSHKNTQAKLEMFDVLYCILPEFGRPFLAFSELRFENITSRQMEGVRYILYDETLNDIQILFKSATLTYNCNS